MNSWSSKDKITGKTYSRKPYIKGEVGDYREMMDTIPRKAMLDQRLEKKSQLDKPYLKDDYSAMEYEQPPLPGDTIIFDPRKSFPPTKYPVPTWEELPSSETWCLITCHPPAFCNGPVQCHFSVMHGLSEEDLYEGLRVYINGSGWRGFDFSGGPVRPIQIWPRSTGWQLWPPNMDEVEVQVWTKDDKGIPQFRCREKLSIFCGDRFCCDTLPDGSFAFDNTSTPDTIAPGGNCFVYVTGGCPPFNYSVSGTGYHWRNGNSSIDSLNRSEHLYCFAGT